VGQKDLSPDSAIGKEKGEKKVGNRGNFIQLSMENPHKHYAAVQQRQGILCEGTLYTIVESII